MVIKTELKIAIKVNAKRSPEKLWGGHSIEGGEFWNRDGALVNRECCPTFQFYMDQATSHCSCPHHQ